jgi:hypothetical protein
MEATMRRLLLSLALALTLSAVGAGSALAEAPEGAQKAPLYGPNPGSTCVTGGIPTPSTFGAVVLNTPGNETTLTGEIVLKHAVPNVTYNVFEVQFAPALCSIGFGPTGTLTTNNQGNGNFRLNVERVPGSTKFFVEVGRVVPNSTVEELFISPAVELD